MKKLYCMVLFSLLLLPLDVSHHGEYSFFFLFSFVVTYSFFLGGGGGGAYLCVVHVEWSNFVKVSVCGFMAYLP